MPTPASSIIGFDGAAEAGMAQAARVLKLSPWPAHFTEYLRVAPVVSAKAVRNLFRLVTKDPEIPNPAIRALILEAHKASQLVDADPQEVENSLRLVPDIPFHLPPPDLTAAKPWESMDANSTAEPWDFSTTVVHSRNRSVSLNTPGYEISGTTMQRPI
jgi:hypothetical protein